MTPRVFSLSHRAASALALKDYQRVTVKPGSSAELPCLVHSNVAQVMWKCNGSVLTEASRFHLMGENALLIYSVAPEDQGHYECWSVEWAAAVGKNFSRLLAGYVLALDVPPRPPPQARPATTPLSGPERWSTPAGEGNVKADSAPLTSPPQTEPSLTPPPSSNVAGPENRDPSAEYLQHNNTTALLFLFLLFFVLFLAAMIYNCYMQYLPAPCLRLRAALLGSHKSASQPEYRACQAGLMADAPAADKINMSEQPAQNGSQNLRALRDTGYETEPECGNGRIPSHSFGDESSSQEKPFDVDCESQPIQFADADEPYC